MNYIRNFIHKMNSKPITTYDALFMWFVVLISYVLFIINWSLITQLGSGNGTATSPNSGWVLTFFGANNAVDDVTKQASSYTITLMRGLASLSVAYIITKFSHKYSVLISLVLMFVAIIAPYFRFYGLFLLSRTILALGGTMLIVYCQPIISRFFKTTGRSVLSAITPIGYPIGVVITFALLFDSNTKTFLLNNWSNVNLVLALFVLVPFVLYFLFGRSFDIIAPSDKVVGNQVVLPATYGSVIREKQSIFWILWYSFWLTPAVLTTSFMPNIFIKFSPILKDVKLGGVDWKTFFAFIFAVGACFLFVSSLLNKFHFKRKPFFLAISLLIVVLFGGIIGAVASLRHVNTIGQLTTHHHNLINLTYAFSFFLGLLVFGLQGVLFNVPHEYSGNTPKRISILFSYMWGFGYIMFTICNVIAASLNDISYGGGVISTIFVFACFVLMLVFAACLRESRPHAPWFPWNQRRTHMQKQ